MDGAVLGRAKPSSRGARTPALSEAAYLDRSAKLGRQISYEGQSASNLLRTAARSLVAELARCMSPSSLVQEACVLLLRY
jgi:hypothetical protein